VDQRTDSWRQARLGKITASRLSDVMAKVKTGYSTSRKNYMAELICERLTGQPAEHYQSAAMQWGTDNEPLARSAYEAKYGVMVEEVGFIDHPAIPNFGASPDGLIDDEGGLEIKCPNTATHIEFLTGGNIDECYIFQLTAGMMCTGRAWWDFVSYDPRLPDNLSLFVRRVYRDEVLIAEIEREICLFNGELYQILEQLRSIEQ